MVLGINAIVDRLINYLLEKKKLIANDIQENTYIERIARESPTLARYIVSSTSIMTMAHEPDFSLIEV